MTYITDIYKRLFISLLLMLLVAAAGRAQYNALVWSDEFDVPGLPNPLKWTCEEGGHGWGNNELQYYTMNREQNARVENGVLIIEALREAWSGREYTSARLVSTAKGDWLYGRFEARAKLPGGKGTWSAIWMLPTDWAYGNWPASGEIDIMEHVGYEPSKIYGTAHTEAYNHKIGTQRGGSATGSDWESAFHVYAVQWDENKIEFIVDDRVYYTFNNGGSWEKWPFDKRFHFILNLAIGGSWGGVQGVDNSIFPQRMEIDYVRVYQSADLKIAGPAFLEPGQAATYSATRFTDATYTWHVPADATITSGDGTSEIGVKWGLYEGEISCTVNINGARIATANYIKAAIVPAESTFWFGHLSDGNTDDLAGKTSDGSTFSFSETGESLRIVYSTVSPASWPKFELNLPRPVNLKSHPYCAVNLKTHNLSRSVSIRFDFADANGNETNSTPVFRPTITGDGLFHLYQNNFTGRWNSSSPTAGRAVDSTRIIRLTAYVNAGFFGLPNKTDSLWIESIRFMTSPLTGTNDQLAPSTGIRLYPNPVRDRLFIQSEQTVESIEILDVRGMLIKKIRPSGSDNPTIDTGNLPAGVYIIRCALAGGMTVTQRFVRR
jgi:beta-glucanase (GH16 family)